jgi:hypothetical protein
MPTHPPALLSFDLAQPIIRRWQPKDALSPTENDRLDLEDDAERLGKSTPAAETAQNSNAN